MTVSHCIVSYNNGIQNLKPRINTHSLFHHVGTTYTPASAARTLL